MTSQSRSSLKCAEWKNIYLKVIVLLRDTRWADVEEEMTYNVKGRDNDGLSTGCDEAHVEMPRHIVLTA